MRIGQTSFVVFVSKLVSSALGFVATLLFARVLGAEVLGFYALALVLAKWLKLGGDVGVASAMVKRISEGEEESEYFTAGLVAIAAFGLVASVLLVLFRDLVDAYVGASVTPFVVLLVLVGLFSGVVGAALQGQRLVHISGVLSPVQIGSRSFVQIALVLAGFGLSGMLVGYAAGGVVVGAIGIVFLSVGLKRPRVEHFRSLFDFAKFSWLGSLRGRSFNDVDVIVLGALVSPALVGVYSVAWSLTSFIGTFGSSVRLSTFPELSRADAEERKELLATVVTDSIAFSGLIAIPGLFGGVLLADRVLRIYGDEFARGATVLGLLILAMLVYDYQNQLLNGLNAIDRPDLSFRVDVVFIVTNVVMNVVLVLQFGFVGAAVATVLSALVGLALAFRYLHRLVDFAVPTGELGRQLAAAALMALAVGGLRVAVDRFDLVGHNGVVVVSLVALGAGVYFLSLLGISPRFRTVVAENSPVRIPFVS